MAGPVKATQAFVGRVGETDYIVHTDEAFAGDHPAVRKWPAFFKPVIEQATAAPGETRSLPERIKAKVTKTPAKKGYAVNTERGKAMTSSDFDPQPVPEPKAEEGKNTLTTPVPAPQTDSDGVKSDVAGDNDLPKPDK